MDDTAPRFDINEHRREIRHRDLIDKLHQEFGLAFVHDAEAASGFVLSLKDTTEDQWAIDAFLVVLSKRMQPAIAEYIRKAEERQAAKDASRLVGGPFDGEQIDVHKNGGTIAKMIRKRWWAVYKRKIGSYPAVFVGYATSKARALTYTLVATTPESAFPAQPEAE